MSDDQTVERSPLCCGCPSFPLALCIPCAKWNELKRHAATLQQQRPTTVEALFSDPAHWTKGAYARNAQGHALIYIHGDDPAVAWCLIGGIAEIYPNTVTSGVLKAGEAIRQLYDHRSISVLEWNDHPKTTHAMVMAVVRKAKL